MVMNDAAAVPAEDQEERITAYKRLLAIGRIQDPAPTDTQDILAFAGHV
ncbi:hypothetical protein PR001_g7177 [Phytophthora rubi]|uniref:Uncharacterized protein n=1 Tax=Phytophthora rubi TaxID=129364 RepID=A0A6A3NIL3_9STRA|nr:hypothetical protein PR001_g7177 [Phytophthora rubi]